MDGEHELHVDLRVQSRAAARLLEHTLQDALHHRERRLVT